MRICFFGLRIKDEGERVVVFGVEELKSLAERVWEVEFEEFETFDDDDGS